MHRYLAFYIFLVLNLINLQYVPGFRRFNNLLTKFRMFALKCAGASIGKNSIIRPGALIINPRKLVIGKNTIVGMDSKFMNFASVEIGNDVEIGPNCIFQTNEHVFLDVKRPLGKQGRKMNEIVVDDNCYLGADVTLLSGVKVEKNVLVGAKSLVNNDLKKLQFYAGVPAVRKRSLQK